MFPYPAATEGEAVEVVAGGRAVMVAGEEVGEIDKVPIVVEVMAAAGPILKADRYVVNSSKWF